MPMYKVYMNWSAEIDIEADNEDDAEELARGFSFDDYDSWEMEGLKHIEPFEPPYDYFKAIARGEAEIEYDYYRLEYAEGGATYIRQPIWHTSPVHIKGDVVIEITKEEYEKGVGNE